MCSKTRSRSYINVPKKSAWKKMKIEKFWPLQIGVFTYCNDKYDFVTDSLDGGMYDVSFIIRKFIFNIGPYRCVQSNFRCTAVVTSRFPCSTEIQQRGQSASPNFFLCESFPATEEAFLQHLLRVRTVERHSITASERHDNRAVIKRRSREFHIHKIMGSAKN